MANKGWHQAQPLEPHYHARQEICDSLSNVVHSAIRSAVKNENIVDAGTRALVLWLAKNKQLPAVAKVKKDGWWAIDDIYYGYFDPK